jgi:DNA-binding NtrC family response regulator
VYPWPYNVRELEHVMRSAARLADRLPAIDLPHLPPRLCQPFEARRGAQRGVVSAPSPLLSIRRDVPPTASDLKEVLALCGGNVARVAAFFRKDRRQIYRWAERLGVDVTAYRDEVPKPKIDAN